MRPSHFILVVIAGLNWSCASSQPPPRVENANKKPTGSVRTAEQANEIVRRHIQRSGGDPTREEISALWHNGAWHVTAWRIWYPNNMGASRFVPGGHTSYVLSRDGRIIDTIPGR
jgi:hypothetical protein